MAKTSGGAGRKAGGGGKASTPTPAQTSPQAAYQHTAVEGVTPEAENWWKRTYMGAGRISPTGAAAEKGGRWKLIDAGGAVQARGNDKTKLKEWGEKNLGIMTWK